MSSPVEITKKAIEEIKNILKKKNISQDYGLRMSIKGGNGCAGMNYTLGFDKQKENDESFVVEGIEVYIQKSVMMYIIGKSLDLYEGTEARGFIFIESKEV